jgi:MFS family permease
MFFASFAWSFVFVSLPFHIQAISTLDPVATLTWTGWILGITSLITVVSAPLWGRLAERRDPRLLYVAVETLQGLGFFAMAAARTLGELFMARMVLGVMGASSTFAFMLAGRAPDAAQVRRQVAAVQSAMTVGQVLGPLAGAVAAARLGFRPSFVLGGLILLACALVVRWAPWRPSPRPGARATGAGSASATSSSPAPSSWSAPRSSSSSPRSCPRSSRSWAWPRGTRSRSAAS